MKTLISAPAKINLFLKILGKDPLTNYHYISTLIAPIDLHDTLTIEPADNFQINTIGGTSTIAHNQNLLTKASTLLAQTYGIQCNHKITLTKNIPIAGGLGGGSSDVAHYIKFCLKNSQITESEQINFCKNFGIDSCFFARKSITPAHCIGFGEIINKLQFEIPSNLHIVLINPLIPILTTKLYSALNAKPTNIKDINFSPPQSFAEALSLSNDFTDIVRATHNSLDKLLTKIEKITEGQSLKCDITGTGSTCFTILRSKQDADSVVQTIKDSYPNYFVKSAQLTENQNSPTASS